MENSGFSVATMGGQQVFTAFAPSTIHLVRVDVSPKKSKPNHRLTPRQKGKANDLSSASGFSPSEPSWDPVDRGDLDGLTIVLEEPQQGRGSAAPSQLCVYWGQMHRFSGYRGRVFFLF